MSKSTCANFGWEMQGEEFEIDLRLLKLRGCDVVWGVDWMKQMSPICFDFNRIEVTFEKEGKGMTLVGNKEVRVCKMIMGKCLQKMLKQKLTKMAQLFSIQTVEEGEEKDKSGDNELLLVVSSPSHAEWEVNQLNLLSYAFV